MGCFNMRTGFAAFARALAIEYGMDPDDPMVLELSQIAPDIIAERPGNVIGQLDAGAAKRAVPTPRKRKRRRRR